MAIYGPPRLGLNIGLFPSPATTERVGAELPRRWNATGEPIGVGGRVVQYARLQRTPAPSNNRERPSFCAEPIRPHAFLTATTADTATTAWILGLRVRSLSAVGQKVRTNSSTNRVFRTFPGISDAGPCMPVPVAGLSQNQNGWKLPRPHSFTAPLQGAHWQPQTKTHPCGQLAHRPAPPAASRRRW